MILEKGDGGEDIVIDGGIRKCYMIVGMDEDDYSMSEELREKIGKGRED